MTLKIVMESSDKTYNWGGTVLGLRQENEYIADFGDKFTSASTNTVYVTLNGKAYTEIFVSKMGSKTKEIGFSITINGTTTEVLRRKPGTSFTLTSVLGNFCALGGCPPVTDKRRYFLFLQSPSNGWNGNQI